MTEPSAPWDQPGVSLLKYEGLGNDFLVLLAPGGHPVTVRGRPRGASHVGEQDDGGGQGAAGMDLGTLARAVCDRHLGWGADGLRATTGAGSGAGTGAALTFELRNADGSEAEMSGNGLRCLAHAAIDEGLLAAGAGDSFGVLTPAGWRQVHVRRLEPGWMWSSTDMGAPKVHGGAERCNVGHGQLLVDVGNPHLLVDVGNPHLLVDVGNPHLVVLGGDPSGVDVAALGPALSAEVGGATGGANIEFVALGPGSGEVTMRVWERGVGETQACGTGSVAVAAALHHWGRVGTKVTVNQPGGAAEVELRPDGVAVLSGPSRRVGRCWAAWPPARGPLPAASMAPGGRP